MGPGTVVRDSFIHHNGQLGIHGGQADCAGAAEGILLENSELSYNNTGRLQLGVRRRGRPSGPTPTGSSCGTTTSTTTTGSGLWTDGFNINTLYEGNVVEDNYGAGSFTSSATPR